MLFWLHIQLTAAINLPWLKRVNNNTVVPLCYVWMSTVNLPSGVMAKMVLFTLHWRKYLWHVSHPQNLRWSTQNCKQNKAKQNRVKDCICTFGEHSLLVLSLPQLSSILNSSFVAWHGTNCNPTPKQLSCGIVLWLPPTSLWGMHGCVAS